MLVKCQLCGLEFEQLTTHITRTHGITTDEYRSRFPGHPIVSDKFKADVAKRVTGKNNPMFGRHLTETQKKNLSEKLSGVNHPCYSKKPPQADIDRRLASWYRNGNNISKENNPFYGKHHSDETRAKMRAYWSKPESRERGSRDMVRLRSDPNSVYNSPEFRKLHSDIIRKLFQDPNSSYNSLEYNKQAIANFNAMIKDRRMCKFNKSERKLFKIIQQVLLYRLS